MIRVHLDTDLGGDIDDICALAFLLRSPEVEVTGITIAGDTNGKRCGYTRYALKVAGRSEIPVAAGADTAQGYYRHELGLPDEKRYWPEPIPSSPNPPEEAIRLLKNSIDQGALVIGIGPYTNLCLLERQYPGNFEAHKTLSHGHFYLIPSDQVFLIGKTHLISTCRLTFNRPNMSLKIQPRHSCR